MKRDLFFAIGLSLFVVSLLMPGSSGCGGDDGGGGDDGNGNGNEGSQVSIPDSILSNCIGFMTAPLDEISRIPPTGAGWTRSHPGPFAWGWIETSQDNYDYESVDDVVTEAQDNNVALLATLWPFASWDQESCHGAECEVSTGDQFYPTKGEGSGIPASRCAPCSYDDYKSFLTNLVERYDGDGTDDMPDLEIPVKYWEILNEPDLVSSDDLTFYKGTKAEYVEILQASYETIKAACSDCQVVQGGAAGSQSQFLSYWSDIFDLGGGSYIDIANVHHISSADWATLNVAGFEGLMQQKGVDKPTWVTEAQLASEDQVTIAVEGAIGAGATKIFFTNFVVGEDNRDSTGFSQVYEGIEDKCP